MKYRATIHWEFKGDSLDSSLEFQADNDEDARMKVRKTIQEWDEEKETQAKVANENRDGWPSLRALERIDGIKYIEQEITTFVPIR